MTSQAGRDKSGFSLLELLVVLSLLGLTAFIVIPSIDRGLKEREVRQSALELAAAARELRSRAVYDGTLQRLIVDSFHNSFQFYPDRSTVLPPNVAISSMDGGEPLREGVRQFLFFPNGSMLGGAIGVSGREGLSYLVRFQPLSGRVEVVRAKRP